MAPSTEPYRFALAFVNTIVTIPTINTNSKSSKTLTNPQNAVTDGDMKDKWLQVRVDAEFERKLDELRKAEADLPSKSEMVNRLVDRASKVLNPKGKS